MRRKAEAVWNGNLKEGNGTMRFGSGAFDGAYSFASRFEEGAGTNPEELLAAAHAGCFSMAFSATLADNGYAPQSVSTVADLTLEKTDAGFTIPIYRSEHRRKGSRHRRSRVPEARRSGQEWMSCFQALYRNLHFGQRAISVGKPQPGQ